MADAAQVLRTREIEEFSNRYIVHPVSRFLVTYFARWGFHPNVVSIFGMILGALAAVSYFHFQQWEMSVLGFALMFGWHVMDGADGQLARLTGKTSEIGKILDGICDYGTFVYVYTSIAAALTIQETPLYLILAGVAGLSHIAQSSAFEFQRQSYDYWVHGKESARVLKPAEVREGLKSKKGLAKLFGFIQLGYVRVQQVFVAFDVELDEQLEALKDAGDAEFSRVRDLYRTVNMSLVRRWSVLSSNPRTLAIFLACVATVPAAYFWFEIVVLNALLVTLLFVQRRRYAILKSRLAEIRKTQEENAVVGAG